MNRRKRKKDIVKYIFDVAEKYRFMARYYAANASWISDGVNYKTDEDKHAIYICDALEAQYYVVYDVLMDIAQAIESDEFTLPGDPRPISRPHSVYSRSFEDFLAQKYPDLKENGL